MGTQQNINTLQQLSNILLGRREQIGFDRFFVSLTCLVSALFLGILIIWHLLVGNSISTIFISLAGLVFVAALYFMLRFTRCLLIPKIILTVLGLIALDIAWYHQYFSFGSVLIYILVFGTLYIWLWHGKMLLLAIVFYLINIAVLFFIEYNHPEQVLGFSSAQVRSIDIYVSFALYFLLASFLLYVVKVDYIKQRDRAIKSEGLKSAFLLNMSHEIRTPMNAIIGFSSLLKKEESKTKKDEYINIIQHSGDNLLVLINDIIDLAAMDSGTISIELGSFNIEETFKELNNTFNSELEKLNKSHIDLYYSLPDGNLTIYSDKLRIIQILSNIIQNAIKFTIEGEIQFSCKQINDDILFVVSDTGVGVAHEYQDKIFERFTKFSPQGLNEEGTGIGLAIVEKLVTMLGGRVWLKSNPGNGTVFFVSIPKIKEIHMKSQKKHTEADLDKQINRNRIKVLLVEDDASSALLIKEILGKKDYTTEHVTDGPEAVEYVKNNHPDLVLMDLKLPTMNGYEATERIREFNTKIPIIAQTANAIKGDREKAIAAGCNDYIVKPLDVNLFQEMISRNIKL